MTFDEIWNQLLRKSPSLAKDESTVEFRADNLKLLLRQVYEQGEKQGQSKPHQATNPFSSLFGGGL